MQHTKLICLTLLILAVCIVYSTTLDELSNSTTTLDPENVTTDVCGMSLVSSNDNGLINAKCSCSNMDEDVDCDYRNITELPKLLSFPKSCRRVSFIGNKISNLGKDTFYNGRNVLKLDLSHNRIDFISIEAFKAFKNLRRLHLNHNKIWNMPAKVFEGLNELKYLNLGYNDLFTLSPDLFAPTPNLRELLLDSNNLQELEPKVFEHLPKLEFLDLEFTRLQLIPDHIFVFTPKLKTLDLSNNQLSYVPTDALKHLDSLRLLDISGNPIPVIPAQAFHGMRTLIMLYMDNMSVLKNIEKYAFGDLQLLEELHCSYNFLLSEIDENAFVKKTTNEKVPLSQLFLRQNALTTIPKDLLNWNENVELHIENNPLFCDCRLEWLKHLKLKNDFQTHVKCENPSYLEGLSLKRIKDHELSCGLDISEIVMITCAVLIAFLIFALIVAFLLWRRNYSGFSKPYFKVSKGRHVPDMDYREDDHM